VIGVGSGISVTSEGASAKVGIMFGSRGWRPHDLIPDTAFVMLALLFHTLVNTELNDNLFSVRPGR